MGGLAQESQQRMPILYLSVMLQPQCPSATLSVTAPVVLLLMRVLPGAGSTVVAQGEMASTSILGTSHASIWKLELDEGAEVLLGRSE